MTNNGNDKKGMSTAYKIAAELLKDRLKDVDPDALKELQNIKEADVLVVQGTYDHIEQVLSLSRTPFTLIQPANLDNAELRPDQIIFVNCPGQIGPKGLRKLESFVAQGGFLFTTDWALKHVLEKAFPGFVEFNKNQTADEVVRVEIQDTNDPFLKSLLGPNDDPQWWLEGSSYPIRILDKDKVHVLVKSKAIEEKYGESPVFITFDYQQGRIYHMISHFYLQRSETRTKRHQAGAANYLYEKNISVELQAKYKQMGIDQATLGEVESAYASAAVMNKIMFDRRERLKKNQAGKEKNGPQKK